MITLPIDPYYHNAFVYYESNVLDSSRTYLSFREFHVWLFREYNARVIVPLSAVDHFEFNTTEDQIKFCLRWA